MITLYTGTPGSGKSYHAVQTALRVLGWNRPVLANFALNFTDKQVQKGYDKIFTYMPNEKITVENLIKWGLEKKIVQQKKEGAALIVIDEAGGRFNAREFKVSDRKPWIDFFSQHAKLGFDFILVAQNDRMIDKQIRGYVEYEKIHRKINRFGPFAFLPFTVFVCIERWYNAKERVGAEFMLYRPSVAKQYDRFKMFSGFTFSNELIEMIEKYEKGESIEEIEGESIDSIYVEDEQVG